MSDASADPEARARRLLEAVWTGGDLGAVDELVADDYAVCSPSLSLEFAGREGYRNAVRLFRSAFPDLALSVEDATAAGETVALRYTVAGTHEGDFVGIPPTGVRIEVDAATFVRFDGGRAVEEWRLYDVLGLMQQLGVAPAPQYFEA